jgi:PKD repeat protein
MKILSTLITARVIRARIIGLGLFALQMVAGCDLPVVDPTNPDPISNFIYSVEDASCTSDCNVFFTNQSQNAASYQWDFGDESPLSTEVDPAHVYANPGAYSVSLKAVNSVGEHDTTVVVTIGPVNTTGDPVACFTLSNNNCTAPCTISFTNCSTNADTYEWDFGDGSATAATLSPTHQYNAPGTFEVSLTATNATGSDNTTETVTIMPGVTELVAITHTANTGNISNHMTTIDNELTNNKPDKILVVTPVLGVRNGAALGVYYYSNKWIIYNQNKSTISANEQFNVVTADPHESSAFVHETSAANIRSGYISTIDHPATNNDPTARIFVTPIWEKLTDYNEHPVGVEYINNRWEIINLNKGSMPVGLKFNVIVSKNDQVSFVHSTTSTSIIGDYTIIADPRTNAKPAAKVIVTRNQGTSESPIALPEIIGVWYRVSQNNWTIFNESGEVMFEGPKFNVLVLE